MLHQAFAIIARPLTNPLKKGALFCVDQWPSNCIWHLAHIFARISHRWDSPLTSLRPCSHLWDSSLTSLLESRYLALLTLPRWHLPRKGRTQYTRSGGTCPHLNFGFPKKMHLGVVHKLVIAWEWQMVATTILLPGQFHDCSGVVDGSHHPGSLAEVAATTTVLRRRQTRLTM
jgi:hypothetical protein